MKEEIVKNGLSVLLLVAIVVAFCVPSAANAREWTGTQILINVSGTHQLSPSFGATGALMYFGVPKNEATMWFAYTGVTYAVTKSITLYPQLGYAGGWKSNEDSFILAGWADVALPYGVVLSLDGEDIITGSTHDTYWYNQVNRSFGATNVGAHWEDTNGTWQWGPHAGVKNGPWKFELRYFTGESGHAVRLATCMSF
jgi:hypothetical protein